MKVKLTLKTNTKDGLFETYIIDEHGNNIGGPFTATTEEESQKKAKVRLKNEFLYKMKKEFKKIFR